MKKNNLDLLKEELKRFNLINEYQFEFYTPEEERPERPEDEKLVLGMNEEEGEEETDDEGFGIEEPDSEGLDNSKDEGGDEATEEIPFEDEESVDTEEIPETEPTEDEVELDVTELVKGSQEAKDSADMANDKIEQLMSMFNNLESKLTSMDSISSKIDGLEKELEKRAPTPEEKLEMRSLDSFPYNIKLTDFWSTKTGQYDVMGNEDSEKNKEYVLTKDDVDSDYIETHVKKSIEDNDYFEEEI